jgi:hypothetical protein
MVRKQLIALVVLPLAGTAALADDITIDNTPFTSQKSRAEVQAEVQAEVLAAKADSTLRFNDIDGHYAAAPQRSALTRDAVRAQVTPQVRAALRTLYPA